MGIPLHKVRNSPTVILCGVTVATEIPNGTDSRNNKIAGQICFEIAPLSFCHGMSIGALSIFSRFQNPALLYSLLAVESGEPIQRAQRDGVLWQWHVDPWVLWWRWAEGPTNRRSRNTAMVGGRGGWDNDDWI